MDWEKAHFVTKLVVYHVFDMTQILMSCMTAIAAGVLVFDATKSGAYGVSVSIMIYFACIAGLKTQKKFVYQKMFTRRERKQIAQIGMR